MCERQVVCCKGVKDVERSGMTMARDQVELCKVKAGEGEKERRGEFE